MSKNSNVKLKYKNIKIIDTQEIHIELTETSSSIIKHFSLFGNELDIEENIEKCKLVVCSIIQGNSGFNIFKYNKIITHIKITNLDSKNNLVKQTDIMRLAEIYNYNYIIDPSFSLSDNFSENKELEILAHNKLNFPNLSFEEIQMEFIGGVKLTDIFSDKSISDIELNDRKIGNFGIMKLANMLKNNESINHLNLRNNHIGYIGIMALANILNHTYINNLDLSFNQIKDPAIIILASMLKNNKSVINLRVSNNQIGDIGAAKLYNILKKRRSITQFDLSHNLIKDEGAKELINLVRKNKFIIFLDLNNNLIKDKNLLDIIEKLTEKNKKHIDRLCDYIIDSLQEMPDHGILSRKDYNSSENIEQVSLISYFKQRCKEKNIILSKKQENLVNKFISQEKFYDNIFRTMEICEEFSSKPNIFHSSNKLLNYVVSDANSSEVSISNNKIFFEISKKKITLNQYNLI